MAAPNVLPRVTSDGTVSGVRHAGAILDLFTPHAPEWGARGTARELGISKSHAQRLLSSLAGLGLLERQAGTGRYRVGVRSLALAAVMLESSPLISGALPIMRSLQERLDVDVTLAVWDRGAVLCVRPGADPSIVRLEPGDCVAVSTVLLAGRPVEDGDPLSHVAQQPVVAPGGGALDELRARLEYVRAGGVVGDFRGDLCVAAAPIADAVGSVRAALAVAATRPRWQIHKREFVSGLRGAALRLTAVTQ
jgi:DNA-binding IclR family transcriptional regulator